MNRPLLFSALFSACILFALGGCITYTPIPIVGDGYQVAPGFLVVGYFPSWSGEPEDIRFEALTHINYAFLTVNAYGCYQIVANPGKLARLVTQAHAHGVKVLASLGGYNDGKTDAFETVARNPGITSVFIESTMSLVHAFQLDGIDVDWEYPSLAAADSYAALMHSLAERLHSEGRLLTAAVSADGWNGSHILGSVFADVDFLNIMAYDDGYRQVGVHHSSYDFALAAMRYWRDERGVPASKVILGVPFYARSLKTRRSLTYRSISAGDWNAPGKDVSGEYGYNGFATMRDKTLRLARNLGGGIMIWQIAQDAPGDKSLLNAIFDAVKVPRQER
ncbi:MAG: glycosyl hydrolase family 18 protein [Spirochaetia bacterium]|jgi:GH18 family chitinase